MSRIGKMPIALPAGVTAAIENDSVRVKGPKGSLEHFLPQLVGLHLEGGEILVRRQDDSRQARANHGLTRALVANMVTGVTQGFERRLEIQGVGFRAEVKARKLVIQLGYSHPVEYDIPEGIEIGVDKNVKLVVKGIDKQKVGQVAAVIRGFRKPDSYKGKGIRYEGETVRLKAGKSS